MANFTTLYSGSSGNCAVIEENGRYLLVDMGKSCRLTINALKSLELPLAGLGGILVTHEHSDHISGLNVFLKKHNVPVYGSAATLDCLAERDNVPPGTDLIPIEGCTEDIAGFGVQSFSTSHDSADCRGYRITTPQDRTLAIATDLGFVSDEVLANLYLADVVALECNYDLHMLMTGRYPYYLKTRVASKRGHLCNDETAATLAKLLQAGCEKFSLCHISQENNAPDLALQTVRSVFLEQNGAKECDCILQAASRHEISPLIGF